MWIVGGLNENDVVIVVVELVVLEKQVSVNGEGHMASRHYLYWSSLAWQLR